MHRIPVRPIAAVAAFLLVSGSAALWAELPPSAYQEYQREAPEALTITVRAAKITQANEWKAKRSSIVAEAQVDSVTRSASGLKQGDVIRIGYEHRSYRQPVAGPSQPDILREARSYPAFLRKRDDGTYAPAAGGYSFRHAH